MSDTPESFVTSIIKGLVTYPDAVRAEMTKDERGVLLTIFLDPLDMGKVIGRAGQTINAIRMIARGFGAKRNMLLSLKLDDPRDRAQQEI